MALTPVVRYLLLCDDVREEPDQPNCRHIDGLMSNIVSREVPPYPLVREMICVFLVLTECQGRGIGQVRVAYEDDEPPRALFGSPEGEIDFTGADPLESLGVTYRLEACPFRRPGRYTVQFWYNGAKLAECPLRLR
jgi:hypothetical protein